MSIQVGLNYQITHDIQDVITKFPDYEEKLMDYRCDRYTWHHIYTEQDLLII